MIEAHSMTKRYGEKVAVDDLSFTVRPGIVTGFLGPNGAGKSTTMRLIIGLDSPTGGNVTVNGKAYRDHPAPLHEVGTLLEARAIHTGRSAYNHLLALAQTHGIGARRVDEVIDLVGLREVARKRVGGFSLGMGQRLGIAAALLGDPETLILDEPANGLDPEGIRWIRTLLRDLAAEGRTIFVSSHLMSEMSLMADQLIVVGRGRLIASTTVDDFIRQASSDVVRVRTPDPQRLAAALAGDRRHGDQRQGAGRARGEGTAIRRHRRRRRCGGNRAPRADARAGIARGGVHATHEGRGRVPREHGLGRRIGNTGMSTPALAQTTAARRARHTGRVTQLRVARSEWTKLWSLRSTRWSLLVAVIAMAGIGILFSAVQMAHWNQMSQSDRLGFDPVDRAIGGWHFAELAIGVLGVLVITGEYSTGMIRSSFAAVPRRLPVLWAKAAVYSAVVFALMLPSAVLAFFVSQAIDTQHHVQTTIGAPHVLRAVVGSALFLTAVGFLGLALGALVRNTAGGIATFAGVMFVLPGVSAILPNSWGDTIDPYLPLSAGTSILSIHQDPSSLAPWTGFLLFCGYALAAMAISAWLLVRRDA